MLNKFKEMFQQHKDAKETITAADQDTAITTIDTALFNDYLPYRYVDDGIFVNTNSIGIMYIVPTFSGMDDQAMNSFYNMIIKELPEGWDIKVTLECHGRLGQYFDRMRSAVSPKVSEIFAKVIDKQVRFYQYAVQNGFETKDGTRATLRDYCVYVEIAKQMKESEYLKKRNDIKEEIKIFEKSLKQMYRHDDKAGKQTVFRLDGDQLVNFIGNFLGYDNTAVYADKYEYDSQDPINMQVTPDNFTLVHHEDAVVANFNKPQNGKKVDIAAVSMSLKTLRDYYSMNMIPDTYADITKNSALVDVPFIYSVYLKRMSKGKSENLAYSRKRSFKAVAGTALSQVFKSINFAYREWDGLQDEIKTDQNRLCEVFFNLTIFEHPDYIDQKAKQVYDAFYSSGFEIIRHTYTQLQSYIAQLPFTITNGLYNEIKAFGRVQLRSSWNGIQLMPVVTDWSMKGTGVVLPSFRNQFVSFNQFVQKAGSAHNVAVAAKTGAGKSFLVLCWIFYVLSQGGRAWIIDRGDSYKHLCDIIGGQYLNSKNIRLNPFTFCNGSLESLANITEVICIMAYPTDKLSQEQKALIGFAVQRTWVDKGTNATIDDLIAYLRADKESAITETQDKILIHNLITVLEEKYASNTRTGMPGKYSEYFNEPSNLDPKADLTVLELKGFPEELLTSVMFILMLNINEQIYTSDRSIPKVCVIDEAWKLLSSDLAGAAQFIEEGYRTVRKHGGSYVTIVQSLVEDYINGTQQAKICYAQSSYKFTLYQDTSDDSKRKLEDAIGIANADMVSRFGEAGTQGYSSMLLTTDSSNSFHRLFVDPFSRVLFSTDGDTFQQIENYVEAGHDIYNAVRLVALEKFGDEIKRVYGEDF